MQITKPNKQRKRLFKAPDHIRYKHFSVRVSPELRASQRIKSIPVRSGDTIQVTRGDHKGFEGKIIRVERKKYRIYVEGLRREKVDGTTISVPIHPSKVMITNLNLEDKWRKKILERKKEIHRIEEVPTETALEVDIKKKETTEEKPKKRKRRTTKRKTQEKTRSQKEKTRTLGKRSAETKRPRKTRKRKTKAEKTES